MNWNIEGIAILLSQWAFGIAGFGVVLLWLFWLASTLWQLNNSEKERQDLFDLFKWRFARIVIVGLVMVAITSALGTYRPRITAGSGPNSGFGSMATTPKKEVEVVPAWQKLKDQQDKEGHQQSEKVREGFVDHTPNK